MRIEDKNNKDNAHEGNESSEETTEVSHRPLTPKYHSKWKDYVEALKLR